MRTEHVVSFPCVSLRVAGGAVERRNTCQPAVNGVYDDGPFSNARRNPLNRVGADIPYGKDARNTRFVRGDRRPPVSYLAGLDEPLRVDCNTAVEPIRVGNR